MVDFSRVLRRKKTASDLFHDQGVVVGKLLQHTSAEQIRPAITDVRHRELIALHRNGNDRRTHTRVLGVSSSLFMNGLIG